VGPGRWWHHQQPLRHARGHVPPAADGALQLVPTRAPGPQWQLAGVPALPGWEHLPVGTPPLRGSAAGAGGRVPAAGCRGDGGWEGQPGLPFAVPWRPGHAADLERSHQELRQHEHEQQVQERLIPQIELAEPPAGAHETADSRKAGTAVGAGGAGRRRRASRQEGGAAAGQQQPERAGLERDEEALRPRQRRREGSVTVDSGMGAVRAPAGKAAKRRQVGAIAPAGAASSGGGRGKGSQQQWAEESGDAAGAASGGGQRTKKARRSKA
jgi:hypothetical protein